jgi:hypothetical protein
MASQQGGISILDVSQIDVNMTDPVLALPPLRPPAIDPELLAQTRSRALSLSASNSYISPDSIHNLSPVDALTLLSVLIDALLSVTGDTPLIQSPNAPSISSIGIMQWEKAAMARSRSEQNLARLQQQEQQQQQVANPPPPRPTAESNLQSSNKHRYQPIDGVQLKHPPAPPPTVEPHAHIVIGENMQSMNVQHSAIVRKFYSKTPPEIALKEYLLHLWKFCPMSTSVYLATSLYIFRLAVEERALAVTKRNCHRLLLAGMTVAMKAIEDLSYPHARIARVGGVSAAELTRLEVNFCFLVGFTLVVDKEALEQHWETLKQVTSLGVSALGLDIVDQMANLTLNRPNQTNQEPILREQEQARAEAV